MSRFTLADLEQRVRDRAGASAEKSYTRQLLDKGVGHCAKKFGEEAVEAVIAAVARDRKAIVSETADVIYHMLVLLAATGIPLDEVMDSLERRTAQTGLQEKASRG